LFDEPSWFLQARLLAFKQWLGSQPEERVAVVAHWGVIKQLTGRDADNCQVVRTSLRDLLSRPLTLET